MQYLKSLISLVALVFVAGCYRAPTRLEMAHKEVDLVFRYMATNDPADAEIAMLELVKYLQRAEKAGSLHYRFDAGYGAVYSRLYLVDKYLGKEASAASYYLMASNCWCKSLSHERKAPPTPDQMRGQIEGVDGYVGPPRWKKPK